MRPAPRSLLLALALAPALVRFGAGALGLPPWLRIALVGVGLLYVPGIALDGRLDPGGAARDGRLLRLPWAFLWSLVLLTVASTAALLARLPWEGFTLVLVFLPPLAAAFVAPRRGDAPAPAPFLPAGFPRDGALLLLLSLLLAFLLCVKAGAEARGDASGHLSTLHALVGPAPDPPRGAPRVDPPREIFFEGEPLDPRYAYATWHVILAGIARAAGAGVLDLWTALPALLFPLPILAGAALDRALRGSRGGTAMAVGFFLFAILGPPAVRHSGYYQFPAFFVAWPLAAVVLLRELAAPAARHRLLAAAILFASASANPFYGGFLPLAAVSLVCAAAVVFRRRFGVPPGRPILFFGFLLLGALLPLALRAQTLSVENPVFRDPARAVASFEGQAISLGAGMRFLKPTVLGRAGFWDFHLLFLLAPVLAWARLGRRRDPPGLFVAAATGGALLLALFPPLFTALERVVGPVYAWRLPTVIPSIPILADAFEIAGGAWRAVLGRLSPAALGAALVLLAGAANLAAPAAVEGALRAAEEGLAPDTEAPIRGEYGGRLFQVVEGTLGPAARALRLSLGAVDRDPGDLAMRDLATRVEGRREEGALLARPDIAFRLAGYAGVRVVGLRPDYASPAAADAVVRFEDAGFLLSRGGDAARKAALLRRYRVRFLVVRADVRPAEDLGLPGFSPEAREGAWRLWARPAPPR